MKNGTTMYGNITTSLMGTIGSRACSYLSFELIKGNWTSYPAFSNGNWISLLTTISLVMVSSR